MVQILVHLVLPYLMLLLYIMIVIKINKSNFNLLYHLIINLLIYINFIKLLMLITMIYNLVHLIILYILMVNDHKTNQILHYLHLHLIPFILVRVVQHLIYYLHNLMEFLHHQMVENAFS